MESPRSPLGAKLELTHACNLRCGFCYTDSPRHTLARTPDLSDDQWRQVVDDLLAAGVLEAVITGGEALLRRDLTLELVGRLSAAAVSTTLVTNGWFVDPTIADRLAASLPYISVNVSLDGATPELHDRSRGLPGSWRRAVHAIDLLITRGVFVRVAHVVTPDNEHLLADLVDRVAELGVTSLRVTPVAAVGAAARERIAEVDFPRIRRTVADGRRRHGPSLTIQIVRGDFGSPVGRGPVSVIVRPDGSVMTDTVDLFVAGDIVRDGIDICWDRVRRGWREPRSGALTYGGPDDAEATDGLSRSATALKPVKSTQLPGDGDRVASATHVRRLALSRPLGIAQIRSAAGVAGGRYLSTPAGGLTYVNATAAAVMEACGHGGAQVAVDRLAARYPSESIDRIEADVLRAVRDLERRGVLVYSAGSTSPRARKASTAVDASRIATSASSP